MTRREFYELLSAAVRDLLEHGYDSRERVQDWLDRIRRAMHEALVPESLLRERLVEGLSRTFRQQVETDALFRRHPGVARYTIERLRPQMRQELDRRILASANLIRLNRRQSIERTLQRFEGWATAIPAGGRPSQLKRPVDKRLRKAFQSLPFEERRVIVDQGHKLTAAINDIVAEAGDAIAQVWHSHWRETGYDYRPRHKQFDGMVFLLRGNWAQREGLVKLGGHLYADQIERPAELPFCRCYATYLYSPSELPEDMLTAKGRRWIKEARRRVAAA